MGHRDRSEKHKDKKQSSKESSKSRKRKSRERSIEIISEEKLTNVRSDQLIIDDDDGEALTKRLNASLAKAKERKMRMGYDDSYKTSSPTTRGANDGSVILLFNTDEIPLPSDQTINGHEDSKLSEIKLPDKTSTPEESSQLNSENLGGLMNNTKLELSHNPPQPPLPSNDTFPPTTNPPLPPSTPPLLNSYEDLLNQNHQLEISALINEKQFNNKEEYINPEPIDPKKESLKFEKECFKFEGKTESTFKFGQSPPRTQTLIKFGQSPPRTQTFITNVSKPMETDETSLARTQTLIKFGQSPPRTQTPIKFEQSDITNCSEPMETDQTSVKTELSSFQNDKPTIQTEQPSIKTEFFKMKQDPIQSNPQPSFLGDVPKPLMKKPMMMMMSLNISQTSAALISSGVMQHKPEEEVTKQEEAIQSSDDSKKANKSKKSRWGLDADENEVEDSKKDDKRDKKDSSWRNRSSRSRSRSAKKENKSKKERSSSPKKSKSNRDSKSKKTSRDRSKDRSNRSRSRSKNRSNRSRSRSKNRSKRHRSRSKGRSRRSRSRDRSRRSRSRSRRSRSRSRNASRRSRNRSRRYGRGRDRSKRSASGDDDREVDNGLNIDKTRLRQIALKNAFKMGLTTLPASASASVLCNSSSTVLGKKEAEAADAKNSQSIKDLTDFCKKIADVKDEELDKIVEGGLVVVDEEEMPFIPARTNKDMKNAPQKVQTLQEKLMEMATISSLFPVSSGNEHQNNPSNTTPALQPKVEGTPAVNGAADEDVDSIKPSYIDKETLKMNNWVAPGQFISHSSTPSKPTLQLETGPRPDKDMFTKAPKVTGGIGRMMLMKLGWKDGDGLGKNNNGMTDLIPVNIKTDRKGFVCSEEDPDQIRMKMLEKVMVQQSMLRQMAMMRQAQMMQQQRAMMMHGNPRPPLLPGGLPTLRMPVIAPLQLSGARQPLLPMPMGHHQIPYDNNNAVSKLTETCTQKAWTTPQFILFEETDTVTKSKLFKFKIILNGKEYISPKSSSQKKQAKNDAAMLCLRTLGVV